MYMTQMFDPFMTRPPSYGNINATSLNFLLWSAIDCHLTGHIFMTPCLDTDAPLHTDSISSASSQISAVVIFFAHAPRFAWLVGSVSVSQTGVCWHSSIFKTFRCYFPAPGQNFKQGRSFATIQALTVGLI